MSPVIEYYLKFNVLLAAVYFVWWLLQKSAELARVDQRPGTSLKQARLLLSAIIAVPMIMGVVAIFKPSLLQGTIDAVIPGQIAGIQNVSAGLVESLQTNWGLGAIIIALGVGLFIQTLRLGKRWLALKSLVESGCVWRSFSVLDIILSEEVLSPFSTKVLGRNQVVIPYHLVNSPEIFRIAVRHEIQHLRNGDLSWVIIIEALKLLCFWNPVVYFWQNSFDCLQEYACDEALTELGKLNSKKYGNCLLEVASYTGSENRFLASSFMVPRFSVWGNSDSQLKRRIIMLGRSYKTKFEIARSLLVSLVFVFLAVGCAAIFPNSDAEPEEFIPIVTIAPRYPSTAIQEGLQGWVKVEFSVDENGGVYDAEVVDECVEVVEGECSAQHEGMFDKSALTAVLRFKFNPRTENNQAVHTHGVNYLFKFALD